MKELLTNPIYCLPLTIGIYLLTTLLYKKVKFPLFQPLLVTLLLLIFATLYWEVPYKEYASASELINFMLGPSVVALGYLLYEQSKLLKGRLLSILTSVFIGAFVGIVTAGALVYLFGAGHALVATMYPKSVTTPIAMALSEKAGGIPSLTAVIVVITGVFGGIISPYIFKIFRIKSPIAKGLALGASAHGMGTATAIQLGAIEGALGGMAIGIMGFFTSLLIPLVEWILTFFK